MVHPAWDIRRETLMVFHVACGQMFGMYPFEFSRQFPGQFAQRIDQHIEAAAMRHADDGFLDALGSGALQQMIQHRNQRIAAFQGKPLLS